MLPMLLFAALTLGAMRFPLLVDYPHVRATDSRIRALIDDARHRSATFALLYQALQQGDVILFIEVSHDLRSALAGRLVLITATPAGRYLRAEVQPKLSRPDLVATIAHEMQHALEIANATLVRDERTVAAFYHHIGLTSDTRVFDTEEAQKVARRVRRELLA